MFDTRVMIDWRRSLPLLAALALLTAACGGGDGDDASTAVGPDAAEPTGEEAGEASAEPEPEPDPTTTTEPTTTEPVDEPEPEPVDTVDIGTVVDPDNPVPAGAYTAEVLGDGAYLEISDDDAFVVGRSSGSFLNAVPPALNGENVLVGFISTVGIVPPREAGIHQEHDPIVPDVTVDIPADLSTWLDAVPQVAVVDSGTSEVAGAPAAWWRLTVDPAAGDTFHCPFGDHCAGFVVNDTFGVTVLAPEIDVTVWLLDAMPGVMPWLQVEDEAHYEPALAAITELLDGLSVS